MHLCHHLFTKHADDSEANIADLFLEETLKKAVVSGRSRRIWRRAMTHTAYPAAPGWWGMQERLRRTDPDEEELTLADLQSRPLGWAFAASGDRRFRHI